MRSTQTKVMAALQAAAYAYDLDLVTDTEYSNRGYVRFETQDLNSTPVLTFGYDFQPTYWIFSAVTPALDVEGGQLNSKGQEIFVALPYDKGVKPEDVIKAIRDHLARWKQNNKEDW